MPPHDTEKSFAPEETGLIERVARIVGLLYEPSTDAMKRATRAF
jgi:hypothetical protein